jgi:hypothetical protein
MPAAKDKTPEPEPEAPPTVERFPNGWSLITVGSWQISVGPDGLLMLPRHLHPSEVADFCAAATTAAEEGARIVKENKEREAATPLVIPDSRAIVTEAGQEPAAGTVPMVVREGYDQPAAATIGRTPAQRARRNGQAPARRGRNPQTNPDAMPGARRRRT